MKRWHVHCSFPLAVPAPCTEVGTTPLSELRTPTNDKRSVHINEHPRYDLQHRDILQQSYSSPLPSIPPPTIPPSPYHPSLTLPSYLFTSLLIPICIIKNHYRSSTFQKFKIYLQGTKTGQQLMETDTQSYQVV